MGANIAFVFGKPFSSTELIKLTLCLSIKFPSDSAKSLIFIQLEMDYVFEEGAH